MALSPSKLTPKYIEAAIDGEVSRVANAIDGDRNNTLYKASAALGSLSPHIDEREVKERLVQAAQGYTQSDGIKRTLATIDSGWNAGSRQPREIAANDNSQLPPNLRHDRRERDCIAAALRDVLAPTIIPAWTAPDDTGKPRFVAGDDLVQQPSETRRHYYRHNGRPDGESVLIKLKMHDGKWAQWFRVRNDDGEIGWQTKKPEGFNAVPYTGALDPFCLGNAGNMLAWPEGEKDVDTLVALGIPALTFGGTSDLPQGSEEWVAGRHVVILTDNHKPGRDHGEKKAALCVSVAASLKVVHFPDTKDGGDVTDWLEAGHTRNQLLSRIGEAVPWQALPKAATTTNEREWPDPKPLPSGLIPVQKFDFAFLPESLGPWARDISERMQCPPDFVGVSATVGLGAVIGRRIGVRPQRRTDWIEVPNMWGCVVGNPGTLKSPAMKEGLKPLHHLEAKALQANAEAQRKHQLDLECYKIKKDIAAKEARKRGADIAALLDLAPPEAPAARRYVTNDTTYEALGEVLRANPNGVLAFRDELVSLLKTLDQEQHAAARGFFLTAWNGTSGYTFDRIGRGTTHIEGACLSLLGSTQPGRISEYVRRARSGGAGDDGLIQRFGLLVWPDQNSEWQNVDRYPDRLVRESAWSTFARLDGIVPGAIGATKDEYENIPYLHFDERAQDMFDEWRSELEGRLRSGELHVALESHFAKYRKLVPSIALIIQLADHGRGSIGEKALSRALAYAEYLESHARRVYGAALQAETTAAKAILKHIRSGNLKDGFSARDIHQHDWSNLSDRDQVQAGLNLLADLDWIAPEEVKTGGRPKVIHRINPKAFK